MMTEEREEMLKKRLAELKKQIEWAIKSEHASRIHAALDMARSEPGISVQPDQLDADPWLLNCINGTLELRGCRLREHRREDYITKLCPTSYDPAAACPLWESALLRIFASNTELIGYFQRLCGYCLTGDAREDLLPILWGDGANGKSLVVGAILHAIGHDYAATGADELLSSGDHDPHPTFLADLFGKRLVTLMETREDGRLNEALIKKLTGRDKIKARRMREDFWEFAPTHKIWIATNHKPVVRGGDHGIWRRLRLIPFTQKFWDQDKGESGPAELKADKELPDKLRAEAPGILAWMVRGCLQWQEGGLREPAEVRMATEEYRGEQDLVGRFVADRCVTGASYRVRAGDLYSAYAGWHKVTGEKGDPMSLTRFGNEIEKKGFGKQRSGGVWYLGVAIQQTDESWVPD